MTDERVDLTEVERRVLHFVAGNSEYLDFQHLDHIGHLERKGYIATAKTDFGQIALSLTPAGRRALQSEGGE